MSALPFPLSFLVKVVSSVSLVSRLLASSFAFLSLDIDIHRHCSSQGSAMNQEGETNSKEDKNHSATGNYYVTDGWYVRLF